MIRQRVLIDIEFTVDETQLKVARLAVDPTGVSDVTDSDILEAVAGRLTEVDWAPRGLTLQRSIVTTRAVSVEGVFVEVTLPADRGVTRG
ncbi:hypothetical protein BH10ACT7_BH10ACT7_30410 [soil metagenome]